jgi:hypothetical protein
MTWTSYVLDASAPGGIKKQDLEGYLEPESIRLGDCDRSFPMSPFYLRIGGAMCGTIINSAESVVDILCAEFTRLSTLPGLHVDFDKLFDAAVKHLDQPQHSPRQQTGLAKLVTKVDFTFTGEQLDHSFLPIVIDVNDLHGGLQWIDDFREYYSARSNDRLLDAPDDLIVTRFVREYVSAYISIHSRPPTTVLICLSDRNRWESDNGYSYKCIAAEFSRQLRAHGAGPKVGITFMESYIEALRRSDGRIPEFKLLDDDGQLTESTLSNIDLVVRNYRKIPRSEDPGRFTFSEELINGQLSELFTILEDERLRVVFDKRYIRVLADDNRLPAYVVIPARIGTYILAQSAEYLTSKIARDATAAGVSDIVVKLADKTTANTVTASFFDINNPRHLDMLEKELGQIRQKVNDVNHLVVDALVGGPVIDDRKIEVRTLVFAGMNVHPTKQRSPKEALHD